MRITIRGNAHALGDVVPRGFVQVASREPAPPIPPGESGRRQLADWIASPRQSADRAGRREPHLAEAVRRGDRPVGRLLRPAAASGRRTRSCSITWRCRFVADGWSQKRLIRGLVLSRTYRHEQPDTTRRPTRSIRTIACFWRMNRRRLDAESLRDAMLAVSGELHRVPAADRRCRWSIPRTPATSRRAASIRRASAWAGSGPSRSSCGRSICR